MSLKFFKWSGTSRIIKEDRSVFDLTSRLSDCVEKYGTLEGQFIEVFEARGDFAANRPDLDPHVVLDTSAPIVIIHGSSDLRVPKDMSRNFSNSLRQAGLDCTLIEIQNLGHFELIDYRKSPFEIVVAQLKKLV